MWEELKAELGASGAFTEGDPFWHITGRNKTTFRAAPVFLDDLRILRKLATLLTADRSESSQVVRQYRIVLAGFEDDARAARTALGITADGQFATPADLDALLPTYRALQYEGLVLEAPTIPATAGAFALSRHPASVYEFIQFHALYISAVKAFRLQSVQTPGAKFVPPDPQLIGNLYDMSLRAAEATGIGPAPQLGTSADWRSYAPDFATKLKGAAQAEKLNFGSTRALAGHALKHMLKDGWTFPENQGLMDAVVAGYLTDARKLIVSAPLDTGMPSALSQWGTTRTYYFGTTGEHVAMAAVNERGEAWITTYYTDTRT
ncbi:hypothetical protein ACFO3J_17920 [Streptomyces polygonati]|uniref:Uncharacterized protein n=1 Tax=Streptomyces polygonati TaxID=1617087 RepID=A0ABV8HMV8_9ACTN